MSQHLEIEFKTLVTEDDFARLLTHFQITKEQFFTQTNYYYDSRDFKLKEQRMGLRIRVLSDRTELTLKVPATDGLLEINDDHSLEAAQQFITTASLPTSGLVYDKLRQLAIKPSDLHIIGSLKTTRAERTIPQGLLALDESWYNNHHDFELELEVADAATGKKAFQKLMADLAIPVTKAPNKIQRMMQTVDY